MDGAILVGVDGSEPGLRAVEWAAAEAARREWRLSLLTSYVMPLADAALMWRPEVLEQDAHDALRVARERAAEIAPAVEVAQTVEAELPAVALLRHAEDAAMVVVGLRGRGGFPGLKIGSVAYQVAAHAEPPVVVVGPEEPPAGAGEVVVGVDGSRHADRALGAAFDAAELTGRRVRAVRAWTEPVLPSAGMQPMLYDPEAVRDAEARALAETVEVWQKRHPEVEVVRQTVEAPPVVALTEAAREARLIVVGARGSRGFARLALGGVAHGLLHHATRPVMVVHDW